MKTGKVYLVGAGPGDPSLVTLKGMECLKEADAVVYDRLLDERLLDLAPCRAERIYVGKVAGEHPRTQPEINQLLVNNAKEGKTVVRLKGGDPFVLGRGGEEAEALADKNIPFEVVPGVTSAVAVPAYAGIPVTHRGQSSSFAVITGHEDPGKVDTSLNWAKLATGVDTLVFLMGMQNLPEIVNRLLEYGRPPQTAVAVIAEGTKPLQKTVVGELDNIVTRVKEGCLGPPAIIIVGEVVRLREKLGWFERHPLFGKRVLVTRARHQAGALSRLLLACGAQPIELPAIKIESVSDTRELDQAIANLDHYRWLIFTSANSVSAFFDRLHALSLDARALKGLHVGAIGPATAEDLVNKGIAPDYVPAVFTSQGIIAGLKNYDIGGQQFLLPRADIADKELAKGITRLGGKVHEIAVYRTVPAPEAISQAKQMLEAGEIDVITFTSSSTVSHLTAAFKGKKPEIAAAKVACIGPKTTAAATRAGLKVDILAHEPTIAGLVRAIEDYFREEV